jgi:hypothetical protein
MGEEATVRRPWEEFMGPLTSKLRELREAPSSCGALLSCAREAAGLPLTDADAEVRDPLTFLSELALVAQAGGADAAREAFSSVAEELGIRWHVPDAFDGLFAPCDSARSAMRDALASGRLEPGRLWDLCDAACDIADAGGLKSSPFGGVARREFADALERAIQATTDAAEALAFLSTAFFLARPESFLAMDGPVRDLLLSTDGLGIEEDDLPASAMGYVGLVQFLAGEMELAHLPYEDFAQLSHAACLGLPLAAGLAPLDRERLVSRDIRPQLARIWPQDEARVEAECARLLGECDGADAAGDIS